MWKEWGFRPKKTALSSQDKHDPLASGNLESKESIDQRTTIQPALRYLEEQLETENQGRILDSSFETSSHNLKGGKSDVDAV